MYRFFYLIFSFLFLMGFTGCTTTQKADHPAIHPLTFEDARGMYNLTDVRHLHRTLTAAQSRQINKVYGKEITQEGDEVTYFKSERRKPTRIKRFTFLAKTEGGLGWIEILVGTFQGRIDRVKLKKQSLMNGGVAIPSEFLRQLTGRSLESSWEVAKDPAEVFTLPSKIKAIEGYPQASQEISDAIRKVLAIAKVLNLE